MSSPMQAAYSIQDGPARRVVEVTRREADELDRRMRSLDPVLTAGAAAAGPGSPVTAALGELRTEHDRLTADQRGLTGRATSAATTAIDAYVAADRVMAGPYRRSPAVPGHPAAPAHPGLPAHPVLPVLIDEVLRRAGVPVPPPRR
jgi:uncharacterized protein DUF6507